LGFVCCVFFFCLVLGCFFFFWVLFFFFFWGCFFCFLMIMCCSLRAEPPPSASHDYFQCALCPDFRFTCRAIFPPSPRRGLLRVSLPSSTVPCTLAVGPLNLDSHIVFVRPEATCFLVVICLPFLSRRSFLDVGCGTLFGKRFTRSRNCFATISPSALP